MKKTCMGLFFAWALVTAALTIYWFWIFATGGSANRPRPTVGVGFYAWYGANWFSVLGICLLFSICWVVKCKDFRSEYVSFQTRGWRAGWKKEVVRLTVLFLLSLGLVSILGLEMIRLQTEAVTARRLERRFKEIITGLEPEQDFLKRAAFSANYDLRAFVEAPPDPPFIVIAASEDGRNLRVDPGFVSPSYPVAESLDDLNQILVTINSSDVQFGSPERMICLMFSRPPGPLPKNDEFGMKRIVLGSKSWVLSGRHEFSGHVTPVHEGTRVIGGETYNVKEYIPGDPGKTARAAFADWLDSAPAPKRTGRE